MVVAFVAFAALIGCKKKTTNTSQTDAPSDRSTPSENTAYTIKYAKRDRGTKWQITREKTTKITVTTANGDDVSIDKEKYDCVEAVIAIENFKPSKLTRAYRYAQKAVKNGEYRDLSYSGKTVLIEKKGDLYTFSIDGRQLRPLEAAALLEEFKPEKKNNADEEKFLPTTAVRIGEKWTIAIDDVDGLTVRGTGELKKAYRDSSGRQCGILEIEAEMTLPKQPDTPSTLKIWILRDGPIDGSSGESKGNMKITTTWPVKDPALGDITVSMEIEERRTASAVE